MAAGAAGSAGAVALGERVAARERHEATSEQRANGAVAGDASARDLVASPISG